VKFIEAEVGIDRLYIFHELLKKGVKISAIISDENLNYLNGINPVEIINKIIVENNIQNIPSFCLHLLIKISNIK
jgi:hypothetical protein